MSRKERFLDRWSRLKETGEAPEIEAPVEAATEEVAEVDERPDEDILAELGLTHPDDLKPGDDVTGFMAKAVPDRLRRMALRQLWRSNPVLANIDGLVEYGEDYTDSAMVVENLQTLYQVGKGMFVEQPDPEEEEVAEVSDAPDAEVESQDADAPSEVAAEAEAPVETAIEDDEPIELDTEVTMQPTRRRMRFS